MSTSKRPEDNRISHTAFEAVRTATLSNNLIWLKSFGCGIRHYENVIRVDHPQLLDYSAWLVFGPPEGAMARLRFVLDQTKTMSSSPDLYVDETLYSPSLNSALSEAGFKCNSLSLTIANLAHPSNVPLELTLRRAKLNNFDQWLSIYSEGFSRYGTDAEIDRYRWLRALESERVQHWFLASGETVVGICQTCSACQVVGIYSFTLRPSMRSLRHVRAAMRVLRAKAAEDGETYMYLERLLPAGSRSLRRATPTSSHIITVRKMLGYRRLLSYA